MKSKIETILQKVNKRREKKEIEVGSIIYKIGEQDKFGIVISDEKYITLLDSETNARVIEEKIFPTSEYFIGVSEEEVFKDNKLYQIAVSKKNENNILRLKYKNTQKFVSNIIETSKNKKINTTNELKELLKKEYNINKWKNNYTNLSIKEKNKEIDNLKQRKEELQEKAHSEYNQIKKNELNDKLSSSEHKENKNLEDLIKNKELIKDKVQKEIKDNKNLSSIEEDEIIDKNKYINSLEETIKNNKDEELNDLIPNQEIREELKDIFNKIEKKEEEKEKIKKEEEKENIAETKDLEKDMRELIDEINTSKYDNIEEVKEKFQDLLSLKNELNDENIKGKEEILEFLNNLEDLENQIEKNKDYLKGWDLTLGELKNLSNDFLDYSEIFEKNKELKKIIDKIGRKEKKEENIKIEKYINEYAKDEIYGIIRRDDIARVLPTELVYLTNEDTENIFYMKFLEKTLACYDIKGEEESEESEEKNAEEKGPIIALLDTSGSMGGNRLLKAKAILLQTLKIAKIEKRNMRVLLFGSTNEIKEYNVDSEYSINNFISFINNAYSGGTDFETPLNRAIKIVEKEKTYKFADIFMLTDGLCPISKNLEKKLEEIKKKIDIKLYTVVIEGDDISDISNFSNEIIRC